MSHHSPKIRQEAIQTLLKERQISDQKMLVQLLKENFGIETNQPVLSRDLRQLKVFKKEVKGEFFYALPEKDVQKEILKLAVEKITYNEAMIVIKTYPSLAAFVGDYIDSLESLPLLGCIAGENTVFVTCIHTKNIKETYEKLCTLLHFKQEVK